jgi:hypothetical protein
LIATVKAVNVEGRREAAFGILGVIGLRPLAATAVGMSAWGKGRFW